MTQPTDTPEDMAREMQQLADEGSSVALLLCADLMKFGNYLLQNLDEPVDKERIKAYIFVVFRLNEYLIFYDSETK